MIYHYNEDGEYLAESEEQGSIPAKATTTKPPNEASGRVRVFVAENPPRYIEGEGVSGSWTLKEDHRGDTVYDTTSQEASVVDYLGEVKPTHTTKKPASKWQEWNGTDWVGKKLTGTELEEWKDEELAIIKADTEKKLEDGVKYEGKRFQTRKPDMGIWSGLKSSIKDGEISLPHNIITVDDSIYSLTAENVTPFFKAILEGFQKVLFDGLEKKRKIKALTEHTYEATTN